MDEADIPERLAVYGRNWPWRWSRKLPSGLSIPPRALLIWRERSDLQAAFDVRTQAGRERLVWWYLRSGFSEFGLQFDDVGDAGLLALNDRVPGLAQRDVLPITWLMRGLADRAGVKRAKLGRSKEQRQLLDWFFAYGLTSANLGAFLTADQAYALLSSDPHEPGAPYLLGCLWRSNPDVRLRFEGPSDPAFLSWCSNEGASVFPILRHPLVALAPSAVRRPAHKRPFGVNLLGHARSRSGVSEDLRMAALVLEEAGIPYAIHDVPAGPGLPDEEETRAEVVKGLPYAINLFTMTASSTLAAVHALGGKEAIAALYNIGFWPWELPELPGIWRQAYTLVDEVWASSRFTYDAFRRSAPVPVKHMPFAVSVQESNGRTRADFGLPDDPFLFAFAFDGLSGFARKAPLLVVEAFQSAFEPDDRSVGLVIKGLRASNDPVWEQVLAAIYGDPRIHLVTQSFDRSSLLDFWRATDCFVSLHRSEGFGRNIAECMALGKPVVVTAYSGNMDFTLPDAAALVPYSLRAVAPGEYPFGTGQQWAEPDTQAAAAAMRRIVEDPVWRQELAAAGQRLVASRYSPGAVSRAWTAVLTQIHRLAESDRT